MVWAPSWAENYAWSVWGMMALILVSCWLLICEVPMFALKFKHWGWKGNELKYGFAAVSVAIFLACVIEESLLGLLIGWCPVIGLYVAISVFTYLRQR